MLRSASVALLLLGAVLAGPSHAGTQEEAVLALHPLSAVCKCPDVCASGLDPLTTRTPCSEYAENLASLAPRDVFLVVARGDSAAGVGQVSCGVQYTNGMFALWSLCADSESASGSWPMSGGGNVISWDSGNCQRSTIGDEGVHAVAGYFYMYAYGDALFEMTANTAAGESSILVQDCSSLESAVIGASVGFGGVTGSNPCGPVPVRKATWGKMKSAYRR